MKRLIECNKTSKRKIIIAFLLLVIFGAAESFAQTGSMPKLNYDVKKVKPEGCELNNMNLEQAHEKATEDFTLLGRGEAIILIARPGTKDKKGNTLIERRLYTARAYLTDYLQKRTKESVITALGENNRAEYGVIEIYVSGSLFYVLAANPNFDVGFGSCDSPESDDQASRAKRALLYPWLYNTKAKRNLKK